MHARRSIGRSSRLACLCVRGAHECSHRFQQHPHQAGRRIATKWCALRLLVLPSFDYIYANVGIKHVFHLACRADAFLGFLTLVAPRFGRTGGASSSKDMTGSGGGSSRPSAKKSAGRDCNISIKPANVSSCSTNTSSRPRRLISNVFPASRLNS
jgi:hypothetical protein